MSETKWDDRPRAWWKRVIAARWVGLAGAGLVSGSAAGEYLVSLGMPRENIFRQYGVVDNAFFAAAAATARQASAGPVHPRVKGGYFIACCRLIEHRKNIRRLIEAFQRYRTAGGQWALVICGDGEDRAMLETHAAGSDAGSIVFAGFQQAEQLARHYAHAACFVHPAINEAWGLVVNEAMACGLPVLVSRRCGCTYDLVRDGINGFTFNPYDVQELCSLLMRMEAMPDPQRAAMGAASARMIEDWGPRRFAAGLRDAITAAELARCNRQAANAGAMNAGVMNAGATKTAAMQTGPAKAQAAKSGAA